MIADALVTGDTKAAIQLIVALVVLWLVVGLMFIIPMIPQIGKTIITVIAAVVSVLIALRFFGIF